MGRIPVFVNTDCLLPLPKTIDWKKHVVWVEYDEIEELDKRILSFHKKLNTEKLNKLFNDNRKLWEDKLTLKKFFDNYEIK